MKIAVLVSGGVDSAVALALLREQGYEVVPFYLKIWLEDELSFLGECPWEEDLSHVRAVCEHLGLDLQIVSLQQAYKERIVSYTIAEVTAGRTPNPDMLCNTFIKFGAFLERYGNEFDKIATGHYAGIVEQNGMYALTLTPDAIKDQTYFLARLSQAQLARVLFPLADMTKEQVREHAARFNLPNKDRKDSQGLCFLGKFKFRDFVKAHVGTQEGKLVEYETGAVVGKHEGFWFYTTGQRQGLGLAGGPWYVVRKDPATNTVFISKEYHTEDKQRDTFLIDGIQGPLRDYMGIPVQAKLRHGPQLHTAMVTDAQDGQLLVTLSERDQGIAPGQFAVFYDQGVCIGSGMIVQAL